METTAQFPEKARFLFQPARYKVLYGGRGGTKSRSAGRALLIEGARESQRILCARELQTSIKDSVHRLLTDQIVDLKMGGFYNSTQSSITGKNGTEFIFAGLRSNIAQIRSLERIKKCWVEEANVVSKASWEVLIPTIREEGSEIWVTFNPELEEDDTYQRFVLHPPSTALIQKIGWRDNPWFPEVLKKEKDELFARDPEAYRNVWEGECRAAVEGAIFAPQMSVAELEGRITKVPYNATKPVHRIWDLGWADNVAIWFLQMIGFEYHLIRYIEGNRTSITDWLAQCQAFKYVYDTDWMPHDVEQEQLASNGKSIKDIMLAAGCRVRVLPKTPILDSINAARTIFANCYFDRELCADGLQCLRHYQYEPRERGETEARLPLHNWASHGADAFRMMALMTSEPRKVRKAAPEVRSLGWQA